MSTRMYVGNLPYSFTSTDLETIFAEYGEVRSARVISDRETGRSRGFGFVEMATDEAYRAALSSANGREIDGRRLSVTEARERAPREEGRPGGGEPPRRGPRPTGRPRMEDERPSFGTGGGWGGEGGGRGERGRPRNRQDDRARERERDSRRHEDRSRRRRFDDVGDEDFG